MQWSLFLFILMGSFLTCQLYEYHFIKEQKTWDDAQMYCKENYTDLATVYDMTDVRRLCNSAKNQQQAWIGLYNPGNSNNQWSLPGEETKLCLKQPRFLNHNSCVYMSSTPNCNQDPPCTEEHGFICYDENDSSKKFHFIKEKKTWLKAQSYCRENHTDLVNGLNQFKELKELLVKIDFSSFNMYWVGDTWMWSDGNPSSFRHWNYSYFVIWPKEKKCAMTMLDERGRWKTDDCYEEKSFFCYDDKVILIRENKTWEEALYYCRENYRDLVSITDCHQQRWVEERAKIADSPYVWLGLRYTCTLEFWFWVSDEVVRYENWASDEKKDECDMSGAIKRGGKKWFSQHDNEKFNFICSKF